MESALPLRERHKARRRGAIVAAARELLHERPPAQVTVERIAERAEVAPATVYNLVGSRAGLWAAVSDDFMDELERRLAGARDDDPVQRARRVVASTCELFVEDPIVSRALLRGWEESGLVLRRGPRDHLVAAFTDARDAGVLLAAIEPRVLAAHVATSCTGAVHQWAAGLIDDQAFVDRSLLALDVALAAAATDAGRDTFVRRVAGRRRRTGKAQ